MKFGQGFRNQLQGALGPVGYEVDALMAALTAWREAEHDIDGHHTDLTADSLDVAGSVRFGGPWELATRDSGTLFVVEPPLLTASQNNWAPNYIDDAVWLRVRSSLAVTLTGLRHYNAEKNRLLILQNTGSYAVTLAYASTSSSANYRFMTPGQVDFVFEPGQMLWLIYDGDDHRWRILDWNPVSSAQLNAAGVVRATTLNQTVIAGGAAGNFTVTGIATADNLVAVNHIVATGGMADLTAEFTITAANTINNAGGTATTGDQLQVIWVDLT